ncbi:HAMP domain-containing protein [Holophaga foetida]|uniref:HAMP domain-containing protein n=1 Tax=Holophaga foetida TaxID=35839 RepID=UPI00130E16D8|nr:HAMP domain-containing protein [Holophaga foetida]
MNEESTHSWRRRGWKPRSLRGRVLGALLVTGLLPVLILGVYSFLAERQRAVVLELSRLSDQSQQLCSYIDKYISSNSKLVRHLALTSEVASFLAEAHPDAARKGAMNAWLQQELALDEDLDALFMIRTDGLCTASSEPRFLGVNYAFRGYFQDAMARRSHLADWQIGLVTHDPCVFFAERVERGGRILGVIVLRIGMARVQREIRARSAEGKVAYLINADGIFLAHSQPDLVYTAITPIPASRLQEIQASQQFLGREHPVRISLNAHSIQTVFQTVATGQPVQSRYVRGGFARWVSLRRLESEPWVVGIAVNETEVYSHSQRILLLTTLACVLTLLLVVFGGFWFSRQILRPLGRLEDTINRFASGEVGVRAPEEGVDEVGRLKHHFNLMADTIQEQTEALAMRVDTLEGILPICASCRKIRNEEGVYEPMESYISTRSGAQFTHGLCEDCARKLYPELHDPDGRRKSPPRKPA